jgi:hypothetical protein
VAFLVTPVATALGQCVIRLTNLQLAAGAQGVIGVSGDATADFQLPAGWPPADVPGTDPAVMTSFQYVFVAAGASAGHLHVNKTTAPVTGTFRIALLNDTADTANMEAYVRYFHSSAR